MFEKKDLEQYAENLSAENWNPEEFRQLMLDDLDSIAGGRPIRPSEQAQINATTKQVAQEMDRMINEGYTRTATALYKSCYSCLEQYRKVIANEPEDGPDIPVSRYFTL